ncbi:MAG: flagellar motor switch protein FliM [Rhizobiales bacterium 65-9]|nr:flagellar motor switch protein FliM [Hyphomicrobiales bacterium]OJY34302.1 MAG: flagellar motor switch protein FliM [Rhizobiales bacterium 65-9]
MSDPDNNEQAGAPDAAASGGESWAGLASKPQDDDASVDRLLNQDEIDSLLGFSTDDATGRRQTGIRAIVDSAMVSYERLPMLEIVFDRLVRLLTSSLRNFFSDTVEVTLDNISSVRFGDYISSIPLPSILLVFRANEWDNYGLISVDSGLAYGVLDVLLGGKRGPTVSRIDGRPYTPIEMNLVRRLLELVLSEAESAFRPLSPVKFSIDRLETNPRFASISRPANAAILIELKIDLEGRGGRIEMLLPYATIEPIRDLLLQSFMGEKFGRDPAWEGHLASEIWQASATVDVVLHETMLPIRRMANLQVGETLVFNARQDDNVLIRCGDFELTEGRIGRVGERIAVQVVRPLKRSRTTMASFETLHPAQARGT